MEYKVGDLVRVNQLELWHDLGGLTVTPSMAEVSGEIAKVVEVDDDILKLEFSNPKFKDYDFWFSTEMVSEFCGEDEYDTVIKTLLTRELLSRLECAHELGLLSDEAIYVMNTLEKLKSLIHDVFILINQYGMGELDYMSSEVIDMMYILLHEVFEDDVFVDTYKACIDAWTNSGLLDL